MTEAKSEVKTDTSAPQNQTDNHNEATPNSSNEKPQNSEPQVSEMGDTFESKTTHYGLNDLDKITWKNEHIQRTLEVGFNNPQAALLLRTDHQKKRVGVETFEKKVGHLYGHIRSDNPLADQLLLNVENAVIAWDQTLNLAINELDEKIGRILKNNQSQLRSSNDGYAVILRPEFKTYNAIQLMYACVTFDRYIDHLKLAEQVGLIPKSHVNNAIFNMRKGFLKVVHMLDGFKSDPLSRKDIADLNQTALHALTANKKLVLTPDVLMLQRRAIGAPLIINRYNNDISDIEAKLNEFIRLMQENQAVELPKINEFSK